MQLLKEKVHCVVAHCDFILIKVLSESRIMKNTDLRSRWNQNLFWNRNLICLVNLVNAKKKQSKLGNVFFNTVVYTVHCVFIWQMVFRRTHYLIKGLWDRNVIKCSRDLKSVSSDDEDTGIDCFQKALNNKDCKLVPKIVKALSRIKYFHAFTAQLYVFWLTATVLNEEAWKVGPLRSY